ncbi:phosphoribosyltransferase family protein [Oscillospiraceae bacterium MB08-C2-2]|nr:phosphoribosyltransferase family protein [Oscillospiraceae bacterium MB08-C2-2]
MKDTYTLNVAGLTRELHILPISDSLSIAAFVMFSDVELTVACATELLKIAPEFDVIITAESKGIPLAYEMARQCGKNYILARKSQKAYMRNPVGYDVNSITTKGVQRLYLDSDNLAALKGKRILIVDDVISTGESLHALEQLVGVAEGTIVGKAAVLAEGDAAERKDILFLEPLPLFFH